MPGIMSGFFVACDAALRAVFPVVVVRPRCSTSWSVWVLMTVMPCHSGRARRHLGSGRVMAGFAGDGTVCFSASWSV